MNSTLRHLLSLPLLAFLSACIAFPTSSGDKEPFAKKRLAFIEIGKSTKEDIATAMPQPMEFLGGDLWLYSQSRREGKWFILVFLGTDGIMEETGEIDYRFLLIRFDENGVVAALETSRSERRIGCNRSGVCRIGTTYMLIAPEEQDGAVKNVIVPENRCAVYVYGESRAMFHFWLDGQNVGGLPGKKGFIFEQLDQGTRQLRVAGENNGHDRLVNFNCKSGRSVFFRVQTTRSRVYSKRLAVVQRDVYEGRQAIEKRKLMLPEGR